MTFTLATDTGQNGTTLTLAIRPTIKGTGGQDFFVVTSTDANGNAHRWNGMVSGE